MKMNLKIAFGVFFALCTSILTGCTEDPYDGVISNEKSIEAVTLGNGLIQVGPALVDRAAGTVQVKVLMQANTNLAAVAPIIQSSYLSKVSPASGEVIDFKSNNNKYEYTVTSESGQSRKWTIQLVPFTETILGTYKITNLSIYGGTGPEFGGAAVLNMTDKPWIWPANDGPQVELDNTLTFEWTGVTANGSTYGKFTNNAGLDAKYADFQFVLSPQININKFYRTMPKGEGVWTRDYTANTVTFTFPDGSTKTGTFIGAGSIDLGNSKSKTVTDNAFDFKLQGVDEWNNAATKIYTDYDKFAGNPRRYWIDVKKIN